MLGHSERKQSDLFPLGFFHILYYSVYVIKDQPVIVKRVENIVFYFLKRCYPIAQFVIHVSHLQSLLSSVVVIGESKSLLAFAYRNFFKMGE